VLTHRARVNIQNRQQALLEQDIAAEHSSMPYRAPELFDVKTGKMLDEKVDIWVRGELKGSRVLITVSWMYPLCGRIRTFTVRDGRSKHSDGSWQWPL